nr:histidine phosphatase family protein [Deinobacterium chartae]
MIKHARPEIDPSRPAAEWFASARGLERVEALSGQLRGVSAVLSSSEPKAVATARRLAAALGVLLEELPGLHEHARRSAPFFEDPADFHAAVRALFEQPAEAVFGEESADAARTRFRAALEAGAARHAGDLAVVAHGTVISLLAAGGDPARGFALWQQLDFLGVVRVAWPDPGGAA